MKIVVLAGGLSPERNVSLSSGTMITHALRSLGHQAALVDMYFGLEDYDGPLEAFIDRDVTDRWKQVDPKAPDLEAVKRQRKWKSPNQFGQGVLELCQMADIVFLAFHGTCGEDGRVQAAFDLMGIPYTGAGYLGSAIAMDKDFTKRLIAGLDVGQCAFAAAASVLGGLTFDRIYARLASEDTDDARVVALAHLMDRGWHGRSR